MREILCGGYSKLHVHWNQGGRVLWCSIEHQNSPSERYIFKTIHTKQSVGEQYSLTKVEMLTNL